MSRTKKTRTATTTPEYVSNPEDMAEEAAQRLCTVVTLLDAEVNGKHDGNDGGYSLYTAIDLVTAIQADLRKSVAHAEAQRATPQGQAELKARLIQSIAADGPL